MPERPIAKTATIELALSDGGLEIRADQLASVTDAELKSWGISRADLERCMIEGAALMESRDPAAMRATAQEGLDGTWHVLVVGYSERTRPRPDPGEALH